MENEVVFDLLDYRWIAKSEAVRLIIEEQVIPIVFSGENPLRLRVISRKLARDSFMVSTDGAVPDMFVKVHKYLKYGERIKTAFRPSRARREWDVGRRMFARGLPVAEPLALGERRTSGLVSGCVLIQRGLPECVTLGDYIAGRHQSPKSRFSAFMRPVEQASISPALPGGFLTSLGELIRRMHSAGFRHPDLHTGNILVESRVNPPKLWLVDLHAAGQFQKVSRRRRMGDLAKMFFSLGGFLDETQLREALEGYYPGMNDEEIGETLRKLLEAAVSLRRLRIRSRNKRCLKTSGKFVVENKENLKLYRRRDFGADAALHAVRRHKEIRSLGGTELIKTTSKSALTAFHLSSFGDGKVFVKEFSNRGFTKVVERVLHAHRGKRAWKAGHKLQILGVPCAEPLALVEDRRLGLVRASYLIMKEICDAIPLNIFLKNKYFRVSGRLKRDEIREKRDFVRAGALILREFHSMNIYQKDFSGKNVLVRARDDGEVCFFCVDSDSVEFPIRISMRRRIKNLSQLNGLSTCITTTDRLRFFLRYFGKTSVTRRDKLLSKTIQLISNRRFRISRENDKTLRQAGSPETRTYEDIASL